MTTVTLRHPDGDIETHIASHGGEDYATVCGIATDGDSDSAEPTGLNRKRLTCAACANIWRACQMVTRSQLPPV